MKFCFGDIVVVEGGLIGVVVKSWGKSFLGKPRNYDVYVRSWNIIQNYDEEDIERYMVRHKELTKEELEYLTGASDLKDRIIQANPDCATAIKRALLIQAIYMLESGDVGTESGITITADGQKAVVSRTELRSKTICSAAVDALKACPVPILYAGEGI